MKLFHFVFLIIVCTGLSHTDLVNAQEKDKAPSEQGASSTFGDVAPTLPSPSALNSPAALNSPELPSQTLPQSGNLSPTRINNAVKGSEKPTLAPNADPRRVGQNPALQPSGSTSPFPASGLGILPGNLDANSGLPQTIPGSPMFQTPNSELASQNEITVQYMQNQQVQYQVHTPDGRVEWRTSEVRRPIALSIPLDTELDQITLDGDGKRAAIQAITAHRHSKLLKDMKEAKTEADKAEAAKKLEANYRAHYASETKWRLDRIAELDKRIEEMRAQVKDRADAEEKFIEAAMTLAKLHAQGIAAEPPQLKSAQQAYGGYATSPITPPDSYSNSNSATYSAQD